MTLDQHQGHFFLAIIPFCFLLNICRATYQSMLPNKVDRVKQCPDKVLQMQSDLGTSRSFLSFNVLTKFCKCRVTLDQHQGHFFLAIITIFSTPRQTLFCVANNLIKAKIAKVPSPRIRRSQSKLRPGPTGRNTCNEHAKSTRDKRNK